MLKKLQTRRADCICTWRFFLELPRCSCQRGIFIETIVMISGLHWAISLTTALEESSQSLLLQIDQYLTRRGMRVKISKAMCSIKIEE